MKYAFNISQSMYVHIYIFQNMLAYERTIELSARFQRLPHTMLYQVVLWNEKALLKNRFRNNVIQHLFHFPLTPEYARFTTKNRTSHLCS
jgi:hypothetical protein